MTNDRWTLEVVADADLVLWFGRPGEGLIESQEVGEPRNGWRSCLLTSLPQMRSVMQGTLAAMVGEGQARNARATYYAA